MLLCVGNHWQPDRCYRDLVACVLIHLWGGRLFQGSGEESKCPGLQRERAYEFITKVHQLVALMNFQVAKAAKCVIPCSNQGDLQLFTSCVSQLTVTYSCTFCISLVSHFWKYIKCWFYLYDLHPSYLKYLLSPSIFTISMCCVSSVSFSCYVYRDKLSLLLERNASHVFLWQI